MDQAVQQLDVSRLWLDSLKDALRAARAEVKQAESNAAYQDAASQVGVSTAFFTHLEATVCSAATEYEQRASQLMDEAAAASQQAQQYMADSESALQAGRLQDAVASRFSGVRAQGRAAAMGAWPIARVPVCHGPLPCVS